MLSTSFGALMFAFGVALVCVMALAKRRDIVAIRFLFFSIACCGWGFLYSVWTIGDYSESVTLFLTRTSHYFAVFIPLTWLHFVFTFINKKESFKNFYLLNYIFSMFLFVANSTPFFISSVGPVMNFRYFTEAGPIYYSFTAYFFILVGYGFVCLIKALKVAEGSTREKLKYLYIGALLGFTAGSGTFVPIYKLYFPLELILLMPLYPVFTGIALIRYGLFDVQEIADAFQREKMAVLGTMAASLNHEIKNPLFVVRGKAECYLDALERKKYTSTEELYEAGKSAVNPILNQVTRALDIIQKFTDFARPFNAKGSRETVVLSEVFQDVRELVSIEFQRSEVKLVHNLTNGVFVVANRRHVEEILSNLVINACHAVGESGGEVSVMAESANRKVKIEVSDTGPGISKENLARVFEPFFTTKGPKGSGLGLYITKQLVERNGGKISVKSKLGEGTNFRLEFKR